MVCYNARKNLFFSSDVFLVSREVEASLAEHDTSKCLAWCHDNKSKLRKLKSTMEFNLRIQEFIELVRADRRIDAVRYPSLYFYLFFIYLNKPLGVFNFVVLCFMVATTTY